MRAWIWPAVGTAAAWIAGCGLAALGACATTGTDVQEPGAPGTTHVVQPGETVFDIARASGLSVEEILEVNGLRSSGELAPGDELFLPAGRAPRTVPAPSAAERSEPEPMAAAGPEGPLSWPVEGVVLRGFVGATTSAAKARGVPFDGILVAAPAGTVVHAAAPGRVAFAGDQGTAYGRFVIVEHAGGLVTVYAHLDELRTEAGATVRAGDPVGTVGTSGGQESPRLHFQVRRGRTAVDPETLLPE